MGTSGQDQVAALVTSTSTPCKRGGSALPCGRGLFCLGADGALSLAIAALLLLARPVQAELLAPGQDLRTIPFVVVDGKPLLAVTVAGQAGRMMLDTGTPAAVILNRDAAILYGGPDGGLDGGLDGGTYVSAGHAASGQTVRVHRHDAPQVTIAGLAVTLPAQILSGDFGFLMGTFGADYLGFIGTPMLENSAFVLDYPRRTLTVLRVQDGLLAVPPPVAADIVARVGFTIWPGGEPTIAATLGDLPILLDFDTGDQGTLYLTDDTRAALLATDAIRDTGDGLILARINFGGASFDRLAVRAVAAGGTSDLRAARGADLLRLGAGFLADHAVLWNFPAGTMTVLRSDARFLTPTP